MKPKYLFMLLGYPGSGKTYFSEQLAGKIGAVRVNADAMRVAAFGTIDAAKQFDKTTGLLNPIVFGALTYIAVQVLKSGNSVICDYQHSARAVRDNMRELAKESDAIPVVIWVKTPQDIAVKRGSKREERLDQRQHSKEKMEYLVGEGVKRIEVPGEDELFMIIDGTLEFEDQYASFLSQLDVRG